MKTKETILKERIAKFFNDNKIAFYDDIPNSVFCDAMEEYAQQQVKLFATPDVSVRTWTVNEIIEQLQAFQNADSAAAWFDMYGR